MKRPLLQLALATALVALASVACYFWIDIPLSEWGRGLGWRVHQRWEPVTRAGLSTWYLIALPVFALLFKFAVRRPIAFNRCVFMFLTLMWTGLLVAGLKFLFGRFRPMLYTQGQYGFDPFEMDWARNSMPSGHAATIVALAACLWVLFPRVRWLWVALALPIALSRVVIATHYLSDVIVGAHVAAVMMLVNLWTLERWGVRLRGDQPVRLSRDA